MKNLIPWKWGLGLAVVLPLAGWCLQQASSSPKTNVAVVTPEPLSEPAATVAPADAPAPAETAPEADPADAAVRPITAEKPLPPNIKLTAAAADVIKLADSGVEQSILLAYITNSTSTFNLGSDEIIYLNDLGIPSTVVTAMIEHDQVLKEALTAQAAAAAVPNQPDSASLPAPGEPPPSAPEPPAVEAPLIPSYDTGYYPPPQPAAATYSTLYDSLAPYGTWVDVEGYGQCWHPTVVVANPEWQPYFDCGRWLYSDCGWYWLSDYSWGWAPFHYGRWFRHHRLGWCWRPDTVWGPSWVCWRYTSDYCGWAPLPPRAWFSFGIGLTDCGRRVSSSFGFGLGRDCFHFIPTRYVCDHHLRNHTLTGDRVASIFNTTTVSSQIVANNHRIMNHGLAPDRVAVATHSPVRPVAIHEINPKGAADRHERLEAGGHALAVFRPHMPPPVRTQALQVEKPRVENHPDHRGSVSLSPGHTPTHHHAVQPIEQTAAAREMGNGHSVSKQEPWTTQFRGTVPAAVPVHPQPSTTQAKTEAEGVPPGSLIIRHSPERHEHPAPAVTVTKPLRDEPKPAADMKPQHGFSHPFMNQPAHLANNPAPKPTAQATHAQTPSVLHWSGPNASERLLRERQTPEALQDRLRSSADSQNRFSAAHLTPQPASSPHQFVVPAYQAHQAPIEVARQGSVPVPQAPVEVPRSFAAPAYQTPAAVSHQSTPPVHQASAEAPWHHSAPAYTPPPTHSTPAIESQSAHAAPAVSAPSAPASHSDSHSSSGKNSR